MLDLLVAKELVETNVFRVYWVPTHRQYADSLTKQMKDQLWSEYIRSGTISLKETEAERLLEEHRRELRRGQRQRRKKKFRKPESSAVAAPAA